MDSGKPALAKTLHIEVSEQCHHRRCNFLNNRVFEASLPVAKALRVEFALNLDQSGGWAGPDPVSAYLRLSPDEAASAAASPGSAADAASSAEP